MCAPFGQGWAQSAHPLQGVEEKLPPVKSADRGLNRWTGKTPPHQRAGGDGGSGGGTVEGAARLKPVQG